MTSSSDSSNPPAAAGGDDKVTPELIRVHGQQMQGITVDAARSEELAVEVERINRAVREAAIDLEFEDEPGRFDVALKALKGEPAA